MRVSWILLAFLACTTIVLGAGQVELKTLHLAEDRAAAEQQSWLQKLCALIAVPSVSADPSHRADVLIAAQRVQMLMTEAGMENVEIFNVPGSHNVVYGDWLHAGEDAPTVLIYNHYDTQPEDPVDLWEGKPFPGAMHECLSKDGKKILGRGSSDNKGNLVAVLAAVAAVMKQEGGKLPVNLKLLMEGQEEIGSPGLDDWLVKNKERFKCDLAFSADGGTKSETEGLITVALRGGTDIEVTVDGPKVDVHSGMYGGGIQNPNHALVALLGTMRDPNGTVTVAGFYDRVRNVPADELARLKADATSEDAFLKEAADPPGLFGEPGFTTAERIGVRPTLEVVGMYGGFQGEGMKTIVPSRAVAKIVARLVPFQDPHEINRLLTAHVEAHKPQGVNVTVKTFNWTNNPYLSHTDSPANKVASAVLQGVYGKEPTVRYEGGSIPVMSMLERHLGVHAGLLAFSLGTDAVHSPNENFPVSRFALATRVYVRTLYAAAEEDERASKGRKSEKGADRRGGEL